jgi:hypothetical protein
MTLKYEIWKPLEHPQVIIIIIIIIIRLELWDSVRPMASSYDIIWVP